MTCEGCGNTEAYRTMVCYSIRDGRSEICDRCAKLGSGEAILPDVYWPGGAYKSEALGVEFTSRAQKAKYLKDNHLSEAGDMKLGQKSWTEGTREFRKKQFDKDRPMIRETLRQWRDCHA